MFYNNLYRALLLLLLVIAISIQGGNDFSFLKKSNESKPPKVSLADVKKIFANATEISEIEKSKFIVLKNKKDTLGIVYSSYKFAKHIKGFGGNVPVLIGVNNEKRIEGMVLLKHHESQEYMEYIIDEKLLFKWNKSTLHEAYKMKVDAISSATETSESIIKSVQLTTANLSGQHYENDGYSWQELLQFVLMSITIVFALLVCFIRRLKKIRNFMLIMVAIVMGLMYKTMFSVALLHGWAVNGLPWFSNTLMVVLLLLCIVLPFTTKKQFYCQYMCPYGAVQELAGRVSPVKKKKSLKWLKWKGVTVQKVLFVILLVGLLTGVYPEFSFIEPFPFFSFKIVSWWMIGFGGLFIILSFFYSKPWCQICPTGLIFDSCKKQNNINKKNTIFNNMKTSEVLNLLLVLVIIILLLRVGNVSNKVEDESEENFTEVNFNAEKNNHFKKSIGIRPTMLPLPAVVIGSYDSIGTPNIMTASWAGIVNSKPLSVGISLREATHSYKNIMKTGAFTLNFASEDLLPYADWVGEHSGKDVNKFEALGLTPIKSNLVNAPYVNEFPVVIELRVIKSEKLGRHTQFIGEVIDTKVDTTFLRGNEILFKKLKPILVGSGGGYFGFGEYLGRPGKVHQKLNVKIE